MNSQPSGPMRMDAAVTQSIDISAVELSKIIAGFAAGLVRFPRLAASLRIYVETEHALALAESERRYPAAPNIRVVARNLLVYDLNRTRAYLRTLRSVLGQEGCFPEQNSFDIDSKVPGTKIILTNAIRRIARENLTIWNRCADGDLDVQRLLSSKRSECRVCMELAAGPCGPLKQMLPLGHCACGWACSCSILPKLAGYEGNLLALDCARYARKRLEARQKTGEFSRGHEQ